MNINPLKQIIPICQSETDTARPKEGSATSVSRLEEASFFANLFRVRPEDIAPFLWSKFYRIKQQERERKLRRVRKNARCAKAILHQPQHEPNSQERHCSD